MALVERGLMPSRESARRAVREGRVTVDGAGAAKVSLRVAPKAHIEVAAAATRYVGRGGEKLAAALDRFGLDVTNVAAVDVGASTGGFTDCLLQHGARHVTAVDVGTDQLHERLRTDPRVTSLEQHDVRDQAIADLGPFDVVVADVSFLSISSLAAALCRLGGADTDWIVLVKPQFEVGPRGRDKRGVVADVELRADAVARAVDALDGGGLSMWGFMESPVVGGAGNTEYFIWARSAENLALVTPGDDDGGDG